MYYVGLDVHRKTSTYCILSHSGKVVKRRTVRGPWQKVAGELREDQKKLKSMSVCFEASCGYGPLYDTLASFAHRVVMAHPGRLRLIFRSKRKSDRIDAKKLAFLLRIDEVPASHVPGQDVRQWRELIEFRRDLVDRRTAVKNQIRSLLHSAGIVAVKKLWSCAGLEWLGCLTWSSSLHRIKGEILLERLEELDGKIRRVTRELDRIARRNPQVVLLRTIPGVGARTAETIVAYIDHVERFARIGQVSSYFGLVPSQDASAGVNRMGHITKQGPGTARKYLVEAMWQAHRRCPAARNRFDQICRGQKERRKIAAVATAHWLLRCMVAMLRTGEAWKPAA